MSTQSTATPTLARMPLMRVATTTAAIVTTVHASGSGVGGVTNSGGVTMGRTASNGAISTAMGANIDVSFGDGRDWLAELGSVGVDADAEGDLMVSASVSDDLTKSDAFICHVNTPTVSVLLHRSLDAFADLDSRLLMTTNAGARLVDLSSITAHTSAITSPTPSRGRNFVAGWFTSAPSTPNLRPANINRTVILSEYLNRVLECPDIRDSLWFKDFARVNPSAGDTIVENVARRALTPIPAPQLRKHSLDDYQLIRVLGRGCMGKVFLARDRRSQRLYALKTVAKHRLTRARERTHVRSERDILTILASVGQHPFLIALRASFQDPEQLYLVLDYHRGGDIASELARCGRFPDARVVFYAKELVLGIAELHRLGVIYRDLKPENVLLDRDGHVVLTDFGLSKQFPGDFGSGPTGDAHTDTFCGTAEYLAPEVLRGERYGFAVDWWSLGTLLYEMYFGTTPFWAENHLAMYNRVLSDRLKFASPLKEAGRSLISEFLERDPRCRLGYGTSDASSIRAHPYFFGTEWDSVLRRELKPPYVPDAMNDEDLRHFDQEFLDMTPRLSPPTMAGVRPGGGPGCAVNPLTLAEGISSGTSVNQDMFAGFSYSADLAILGASMASAGATVLPGSSLQQAAVHNDDESMEYSDMSNSTHSISKSEATTTSQTNGCSGMATRSANKRAAPDDDVAWAMEF